MKKQTHRKKHLGRLSKVHALVTACFVIFYLGVGLLFGPNLLLSDIQNKYRLAASAVVSTTIRVWGPPAVPMVTATPDCNAGSSHVLVDWEDDENATSFDVFRGGLELITGLVTSSYQDNNVADETSYSYYVVASGPEGSETSSTVNATTNDCSSVLSEPEVQVTAFERYDMTSYSGTPKTTDRRPEFYGTSNIANGTVRLEVHSSPVIVAATTTNANGYWSWTPSSKLSYGLHTIYVTVIDPNDSSRTDAASFIFRVEKDEDDEENEDKDDDTSDEATATMPTAKIITERPEAPQPESKHQQQPEVELPGFYEQAPIGLDLQISEPKTITVQGADLSVQAYPGSTMKFEITVESFEESESGQIPIFNYSVLNSQGEEVYRDSEERTVQGGDVLSKEIILPQNLEPGRYKLRIEAVFDGFSVSKERHFYVKDKPVIAFQENFVGVISNFISSLGWMILALLLVLLILIIFAIVEYKIHHHDGGGGTGGLKKKRAH